MSSLRHPVGPHEPGVYWRRRVRVLGVVVVVVVIIVLIVVGRGSGATTAAPSASASASRAAGATGAGGAGAGAGSGPGSSASASARASDGAACSADQIELEPVLDKTTYAATEDPQIAMSISNTGSNSCHMDLGSSQQVLTITSGDETYWTSGDCQTGATNQDVTLKAGQTLTTPAIGWDRTRSSTSTCDTSRPSVAADGASYHLEVAVGSMTSAESVQFVLS